MPGLKESHDYQLLNSNCYKHRPRDLKVDVSWYVIYLCQGIILGIVAFIIEIIEEFSIDWRIAATDEYDDDNLFVAWIIYTLFGILYVGLAAILTVYIGPGAAGSGTAEMMAYTNGVRYPNFLSVETFLIKIFGVALAVGGGLHVGKEGPLAHIGSGIGAALIFFPTKGCNHYFRNERDIRKVIATGAGVGVAVAFASPIGGTVFAYQVTRPHVYWTFTMLLKTFWASSLATFVLNICVSIREGQYIALGNAGLIKFGQQITSNNFKLQHIPFIIIAGAICGLLGAVFVIGNTAMTKLRMKYLTSNWKKILQAIGIVTITACIVFFLPLLFGCTSTSLFPEGTNLVTLTCSQGSFNQLATMLWQTEGRVIQVLFSQDVKLQFWELLTFFLVWYFMTMITYGTAVPAGLFFPGILMGCSIGIIFGRASNYIAGSVSQTTYAIACASGILCGYSRLSLSLVILVIEATQNVSLFLPVLLNTLAALWIGELFTKSLYKNAVKLKGVPFLNYRVPHKIEHLTAQDIMAQPVVQFDELETLQYVYKVLDSNNHNGFPVLDSQGNLTGLISRNQLVVAIKKKLFAQTVAQKGETMTEMINRISNDRPSMHRNTRFQRNRALLARANGGTRESLSASLLVPEILIPFNWYDFNIDFESTQYDHTTVRDIVEQNRFKLIDLRSFFVEWPPTVKRKLKINLVLQTFRKLNCRHLPVMDDSGSKLVGIITRKDIINAYPENQAQAESRTTSRRT